MAPFKGGEALTSFATLPVCPQQKLLLGPPESRRSLANPPHVRYRTLNIREPGYASFARAWPKSKQSCVSLF